MGGRPAPDMIVFRLYIAGNTPSSLRARDNLTALCQRYLPGRHHIEVIDIVAAPRAALVDGVLVTPTLVKVKPPPVQQFIGDLSAPRGVLLALGIPEPAE